MRTYQIFSLFLLLLPLTVAAGNCSPEFNKLRKIQKAMNKGYTDWNGQSIRDSERYARNEYQRCRQGKKSIKSKKHKRKSLSKSKRIKSKKLKRTITTPHLGDKSVLAIKGRFSGEKQKAWLKHFKRNKECIKPEKISLFAKCMKLENETAAIFEQHWRDSNIK